jgi:putative ABC transport system substrate-binding protein
LSPESREVEAFRRELRKAGYIEGRNLVMEWRSANGDYDRVPALVADLVRSNVDVLLNLASAARLPTIYETRRYPDTGGLMSYGPDINDLFRRAAIYVNRIFEGEKPADLPVEQPTKFELVINLRTAKTLELVVPDKLIALADDVIE